MWKWGWSRSSAITACCESASRIEYPAMSLVKQLAVLEHAGLIEHEKNGRVRYFTLVPERLDSVADWLQRYGDFWRERFEGMHHYLRAGGEPGP
jgi:DNA-binding transcriptional ArsR family regulator